jgi:hypothetical protein
VAAGATRPVYFATDLVERAVPGLVPHDVLLATLPAALIRWLTSPSFDLRLTVDGVAPSQSEQRALEVLLEDRASLLPTRVLRAIRRRFGR